jgi:uncharacterized membrane protein
MADTSKPAALAAIQGVIGVIGAVTLIAGAVNRSVIAAVNTVGVLGVVGLTVGVTTWASSNSTDRRGQVRTTCIAVGIAALIGGIAFIAGRPMDESEKTSKLLTVIGGISIIGIALLVTLAWREVSQAKQPATKKCPDCANQVLAEARKCQFCAFRFDGA